MQAIRQENFTIDDLFSTHSLVDFMEQYFHRLPFALPKSARPICHWGTWETLTQMLNDPDTDLLLARSNQLYEGPTPNDAESASALLDQGYTFLVRHAEIHHAGIARLSKQFKERFQGAVDAHIYVTPPNQCGFSWHYDAEDVFILQLAGEKEYSLRKNTVNPWPLAESLPVDMHYERELMPLMRVNLCAGDMLYIPCGYWHRAVAGERQPPSISLAVGVMSRSAMDVFDLLRPQLLESLLWRQRIPVSYGTNQSSQEAAIHEMLKMLSADLNRILHSSEFKDKLMGNPSTRNGAAKVAAHGPSTTRSPR